MATTVADFAIERIYRWRIKRNFGFPGDTINGFMGAMNPIKKT